MKGIGAVPRSQKRRVFVKAFADHWGGAYGSQWQPSRKQSKATKVKKGAKRV